MVICESILMYYLNVIQEHVVKEELLGALYCEFINRVNEVGVDVNRAIAHPYTQSLVQYICGLGPRKGSHLLKVRHSPKICILTFILFFCLKMFSICLDNFFLLELNHKMLKSSSVPSQCSSDS